MLIQPYYQSALPMRSTTTGPTVGNPVAFYEDIRFQLGSMGVGFVLAIVGKLVKWFAYEGLGRTISIAGIVIFAASLIAFIWASIIGPAVALFPG